MEAKKHRIRFHSYNDLEINHLIVPFNSIYLNIAFGVFILGQLMFLLGFPLFAKQLNVNGDVMYFSAHLFSWLGEGFLLYSLMRGMVVLKKSFGKLFWAAIIGLTIVRLSLGTLHLTGTFDGDISILLFFVLMIPYYILGFEINHSYYEKLSVTGTLMLLTALLNLTYIIAQTFIGNYLVSDIVCLVCALIYIIFLRRILVGSEHVEDISKLTNRQDADNDESNSRNKQKIERSDRHDREVNYVISPESKQRMNIATALFILAQVMLLLCAPAISELAGIHRGTFIFISHVLKGISEAFLIYCLMKGMASLMYPFKNVFIATIVVVLLFNFTVALFAFLAYFGIHVLNVVIMPVLIIRTIPYFMLGFLLYHRYYGLISHLGIVMMIFLFGNILIEGFLLSGTMIIYDLILFAISVAFILFLRTVMIGNDTYQAQKH